MVGAGLCTLSIPDAIFGRWLGSLPSSLGHKVTLTEIWVAAGPWAQCRGPISLPHRPIPVIFVRDWTMELGLSGGNDRLVLKSKFRPPVLGPSKNNQNQPMRELSQNGLLHQHLTQVPPKSVPGGIGRCSLRWLGWQVLGAKNRPAVLPVFTKVYGFPASF